MINLDPISRSLIVSHARAAAPYEACGLISRRPCEDCAGGPCALCEGWGYRYKIWRAENAADEPRHNYLIAPKEQLALLEQIVREDHELVGMWHSHPSGDPEPSDVDRVLAAGWPDLVHVIVSLNGKCRVCANASQRCDKCKYEGSPSEVPQFWIGKLAPTK